jgi:ABC-type multidrug transport system permease subunit
VSRALKHLKKKNLFIYLNEEDNQGQIISIHRRRKRNAFLLVSYIIEVLWIIVNINFFISNIYILLNFNLL